jgi:phosphoribosyl 1,2-cyclic phosphate phosphodiesterase
MQNFKMRVVIMGCGGSGGVPYAGNVWGKCDPNNLKNRRSRPSVYIAKGDTRIVIDTSPEFRQQINATGHTGKLDAVVYTHAHVDHILGMDDLRAFWHAQGKVRIPIYGSEETLAKISRHFDYAVEEQSPDYPAIVERRILSSSLTIGNIHFEAFDQKHGVTTTQGFRIGDFGYSTDLHELSEDGFEKLQGVKVWVVGVHSDAKGAPNHVGLERMREWVERIKPEMTYLTHMNAFCDYDTLCRELPAHIRPAYDGLEFSF